MTNCFWCGCVFTDNKATKRTKNSLIPRILRNKAGGICKAFVYSCYSCTSARNKFINYFQERAKFIREGCKDLKLLSKLKVKFTKLAKRFDLWCRLEKEKIGIRITERLYLSLEEI